MFVKKEAAKHGIVIDGARVDLAKMQERKDKVVKTFNSGVRSLMKSNKVTTWQGWPQLRRPGKSPLNPPMARHRRLKLKIS